MKVLFKYIPSNKTFSTRSLLFVLMGFALCFHACTTDHYNQNNCGGSTTVIEYLDSLSEYAKSQASYPYYTDRLVKQTGRQYESARDLPGMPFQRVYSSLLDYSLMLVLKGDNQRAATEIMSFLERYKLNEEITKVSASAYRILALAYMRQAEQENCIHHKGTNACIVPLEGDGIHKKNRSTKKAFDLYEKLLAFNPSDYQSLWFYNIAGMALEQYPNEMNPLFVLDENLYGTQHNFPTFKNVAQKKGLSGHNHAGGAALVDLDNDGWLDLFSTSYSLSDQTNLYKNTKGYFKDVGQNSIVGSLKGGLNHIHGDFNNDGLVDIYIARGAWLSNFGHFRNTLLINKGNFCFQEITKSSGIKSEHPTGSIAVADVDLDGDLDLFEGNESTGDKNTSYLYINDGHAIFSVDSLFSKDLGFVKGAVWGDINDDRYPDLFISRYGQPNLLYVNTTGEKGYISFEEIGKYAKVDLPIHSFTCWFWDYNQDGKLDLFVSAYDNTNAHLICDDIVKEMKGEPTSGAFPKVYKNRGDNQFDDVTEELGLSTLLYTMGGNFGDITNNGYPDFYCGTGEFNIWATIPNRMFVYEKGSYKEVTRSGGFGQIQKGHGVSFGDFDRDGDLDIFHQVGGAVESDVFQDMLFENPGNENNWIQIKFEGTQSNRSAIGASVHFYASGPQGKQYFHQQISTGGSFGANPLLLHQGLSSCTTIDSVLVEWPHHSNNKDKAFNLTINKRYTWSEGNYPQTFDSY